MLNDLVYISAATLLPLIPAFVIYRTLGKDAPTKARVSGTPGLFGFLTGLKVNLQGAGAAYFLLVFLIFGYIYTRPEILVYHVRGQIELSSAERLNENAVQLAVKPERFTVLPNGVFDADVLRGDDGLPTLVLSYPGHNDETVVLDSRDGFQTPGVTSNGRRISVGKVTLGGTDPNAPPYPSK